MPEKKQKHSTANEKKNIFVNVETVTRFGRDMMEGITRFAMTNHWEMAFQPRTLTEPLPHWFRYWNGDGIISRSGSLRMIRELKSRKLPMVELVGTETNDEPEIAADREKIAQLIFQHFHERGFRRFAVYSYTDTWWSQLEKQCYIDLLAKNGYSCEAFKVRKSRTALVTSWSENDRKRLCNWLLTLPKPIGLYVVTDAQAIPVLQLCRNAGIRVPDDIAVVAVENDEWICSVTNPPLSSVDQNGTRIGYLAAELLNDRINGKRLAREKILVPPLFIQTRQSSDCVALDHSELVDILHYIRETATNGLSVEEVVRYSNMSHATLGRLFHKWLGHTIEQEIRHIRVEKSKLLLRETDSNLTVIAHASGFRSPEYFCHVFRQETGRSPSEFRAQK